MRCKTRFSNKPDPFTLPNDVFEPCGGGGKSDLVVEDWPWRATPRSFRLCLLFCCCWICSEILGIFCWGFGFYFLGYLMSLQRYFWRFVLDFFFFFGFFNGFFCGFSIDFSWVFLVGNLSVFLWRGRDMRGEILRTENFFFFFLFSVELLGMFLLVICVWF